MEIRETQRAGGCLVYVRASVPITLYQDSKLNIIHDAVWVGAEMGDEALFWVRLPARRISKMTFIDNQTNE